MADWIAVDWGTSSLRAFAMAGSKITDRAQSDRGMGSLAPDEFEGALLELIEPWLGSGTTPVLACGMVGSRQGWVEAAYAPVPTAPLSATPARAPVKDPRIDVRVIPGLRQDDPADVMRGEETQIAGYLSLNPDYDGILCLPGTHTKWAHISAGEVVSFRTFMTGEIFALLSTKSILRHSVSDGWDDAVFDAAVSEALSRPEALAARLFGLRAEGLLNGLDPGVARARLSGLLIGVELAATRPFWLGQNVALIGASRLSGAYARALDAQGLTASVADATRTTLAGLAAARALITETTS